jgi:hypothetical protein
MVEAVDCRVEFIVPSHIKSERHYLFPNSFEACHVEYVV